MSLTLHPYHLSMNIHKENSFCKRDINCKFLLLEIQAKQLWHWYWNIAGINTIYLSIFTLIYSPSIQYNEIIEGLSLGRNIRFNPRLLMVSKRGGEEKTKMTKKITLKHIQKERLQNVDGVFVISIPFIFTYSYLPCTLLLANGKAWTREPVWQIVHHSDLSVTIIRRVSIHYTNLLPTRQSERLPHALGEVKFEYTAYSYWN